MNQLNQARRVISFLAKGRCVDFKRSNRFMTNLTGIWEPIVFTNTPTLPESCVVEVGKEVKPIDNRVTLTLIRKSFNKRGLKVSENRDNLVVEFFNLSRAVTENQITIEEFIASNTFKELVNQLEYNIDVMSNSQIVNLMASIIKMRLYSTTSLVNLFEHEIRFRMSKFNLNQTVKLLRFYNSMQTSSEQKEIKDMLSYRIRTCVQNEVTDIKEINSILHLISNNQLSNNLLPLLEERLLDLLVINEEDELISRYINQGPEFDYESLCDLLIKLAENKRRPTPLLKAAAIQLCKTPIDHKGSESKSELILGTLNALISLSYPNQRLVAKLIADLTKESNLETMDSYQMCAMLRTISNLRWRPLELLEKFFKHLCHDQQSAIDYHVAVTLLHVSAELNYVPQTVSVKQFYNCCLGADKEALLKSNPRKWLSYVWSLVVVQAADEAHVKSILSKGFFQSLEESTSKINFADAMKLLNIHAIASKELKLDDVDCNHLEKLESYKYQKNVTMQKFAERVREALSQIAESQEDLRHDVETPFGFNIDSELLLKDTLNSTQRKCALIYAGYDDMITNTRSDVVGRKKIAVRILRSLGYNTVFLPETLIKREKTSADVITRIKALIQEASSSQEKGTCSERPIS